jgi:hypothetical protein
MSTDLEDKVVILLMIMCIVHRLPSLMARFDELRAAGDLLPSALVVDGE